MTKYIEGINVENCNKLLAWLEAGAPHAVFDMGMTNGSILDSCSVYGDSPEDLDELQEDLDELQENYPEIYDQMQTKGIGACGTVCCIAGAAAGMAAGDVAKPVTTSSWSDMAISALKFLGIERQPDAVDSWMFHDLFDPHLAPDECTPEQAAQALRNVMEGKAPWDDVA